MEVTELFVGILSLVGVAAGILLSTSVLVVLSKAWREVRTRKEVVWEPVPASQDLKETGTSAGQKRFPLPAAQRSAHPRLALFLAGLMVALVFAISIGVVWSLAQVGGPVEASVKSAIEKAGGSILIVGSGLFGAFFAVAILTFLAIHIFSGR